MQLKFNGSNRWFQIGLTFVLLYLTNRFLSFQEGLTLMGAMDSSRYFQIASAAPDFIEPNQIAKHFAYRFFFPYLIGLFAKLFSISTYLSFIIFTAISIFLCLYFFQKILSHLKVPEKESFFCLLLFGLNPYVFRYYVATPAMNIAVFFTLGTVLLLWGLFSGKMGWILTGLIVATLSRQTSLVLLPPFALWIFTLDPFTKWPRWKKFLLTTASFLLVFILFKGLGVVSSKFSDPQAFYKEHVTGIFFWIGDFLRGERYYLFKHFPDYIWDRAQVPSIWILLEFLLRLAIPLLSAVSCLLALHLKLQFEKPIFSKVAWSKKMIAFTKTPLFFIFLFSLAIISQPLLAGPYMGMGAARLSQHAAPFLIIGLAIQLKRTPVLTLTNTPGFYAVTLFLTFASSIHHMYNWFLWAPAYPQASALAYLIVCICLVVIIVSQIPRKSTQNSIQ